MYVSLVGRSVAGIRAATAAGTPSILGAVDPVAPSPIPRLTTTEPSLERLRNSGLLLGLGGGGVWDCGGILMLWFTVGGGKATMKMISSTSRISMNGVTFISEFCAGSLLPDAP